MKLKPFWNLATEASGRLLSSYRDLVFPRFCRHCETVSEVEDIFCPGCHRRIEWIGRACERCATPVLGPERTTRCSECRNRALPFDGVVAAGLYEDPLRRAVLLHKYKGDNEVLAFFASLLERFWNQRLKPRVEFLLPPGQRPVVVPIPSHPWKFLLRGRRPVTELAVEFGRRATLRVDPILKRSRYTCSQTSLPRQRRIGNQRASFKVRRGVCLPRTVIVVDDVVTTLATVSDAARALRQAGVQNIYVLALARSTTV